MKYNYTLAFLFFTFISFCQNDILPRNFSQEERALLDWASFTTVELPTGIESPPPFPVRHMAEWEELQAIAITWRSYPQILTQIAFHAALEVKVLVFCNSESTKNEAEATLQNAGVNMANVELIVKPVDSVWIRDYGPNCVYANDVEDLNFIDWVYNRPTRPNDDAIPIAEGEYLNIPVYSTTVNPERLVNTGGNFMSDGLGTAFASKLILKENAPGNIYNAGPLTEAEIDNIMLDYMGLDRYIKMDTLPYDAIHHIDMHMRLLDEETLLVGEYPTGLADGPQIEANLQYVLDNFNSSFGTPYKVVRILQPPSSSGAYPPQGVYRTYTNAVFVNKTILIPGYQQQYDTTAIRIYKENYPGYKVVSINCNQMIGASGALHCITKEVGANDPLWIVHQRLTDVENNNDLDGYEVNAQIKHRTGIAHAEVFYTVDTSMSYQSVPMEIIPGSDNWTAEIPHQSNGSIIYYYIGATANSSKSQVRPLAAPAGYYHFRVNDDVSAAVETDKVAIQTIFPNPASAITVVPVQSNGSANATLKVVDVFGRNLKTIFDGTLSIGLSRHYFDASTLPTGTYFVMLQTEKETTTQRIVVQ